MIRAFFAVLWDLWDFVCGRTQDDVVSVQPDPVTTRDTTSPPPFQKPLLTGDELTAQVAYVAQFKTDCFVRPEPGFDELRAELGFGTPVAVRRIENAVAEVDTSVGRGWVRVEALVDDPTLVQPTLEPGVVYGPAHEETKKLRMRLKDEALGDYLSLPLQPLEYLLYQIQVRHHSLEWPPDRPRLVGSIHRLFRGHRDVTIGVQPRTSTIIETVSTDEQRGFLGYVVAVQPDESITVHSVGRVNEGEFRIETFEPTEWREFRPVFIQLS